MCIRKYLETAQGPLVRTGEILIIVHLYNGTIYQSEKQRGILATEKTSQDSVLNENNVTVQCLGYN